MHFLPLNSCSYDEPMLNLQNLTKQNGQVIDFFEFTLGKSLEDFFSYVM